MRSVRDVHRCEHGASVLKSAIRTADCSRALVPLHRVNTSYLSVSKRRAGWFRIENMSFERKDLIPTAIALAALGAQVGGFVDRATGIVTLVAAAAMLFWYYATRERQDGALLAQPSEAEIKAQRKARIIQGLQQLKSKANRPLALLISAGNEDEYGSVVVMYTDWVSEATTFVRDNISVAEAEAFNYIGNLMSVVYIVQNPLRNGYRWDDKSGYMQRLDIYCQRLTALMQKVENT
jgi:hypothetical protein